MSIRIDISKGIDPIPVASDIRNDERYCRVDGKGFTFVGGLPFTLKHIDKNWCADKALILKHADKAKIVDLKTLEVVRKYG